MQSSLNEDLERYASKRRANPTPSPSLFPLPSLVADRAIAGDERDVAAASTGGARQTSARRGAAEISSIASSSTSEDSAIEDISRSNPSSKSTPLVPQQGPPPSSPKSTAAIISDARSLLNQSRDKSDPTVRDAKSAPKDDEAMGGDSAKSVAGDDKKSQKLGSLEGDLESFLRRLRNRPVLDLTVPELPGARSFHSVFTAAASDGTTTDVSFRDGDNHLLSADDAGTLSETKFRQGLEASLFFTSDDDGGKAAAHQLTQQAEAAEQTQ